MLVLVQLLRVGQAGAWAVLLRFGRCYQPAGEPTVRQHSFPLKLPKLSPFSLWSAFGKSQLELSQCVVEASTRRALQ